MTDTPQRHLTLREENPNPTPLGVQAVVLPQDSPAAEGLDEAALTTTRAAHAELTFTQINHRTQKT